MNDRFVGGASCRPPQYIRGVNFTNNRLTQVTLKVHHKSNTVETHSIEPTGSLSIDRGIDMGGWQACDPVIKVEMMSGDHHCLLALPEAQGVVIFNVVLSGEEEITSLISEN